MKVPGSVKSTLLHALEARDIAFAEALEDFNDYTPEDIAMFNEEQAEAEAWVHALEVGA